MSGWEITVPQVQGDNADNINNAITAIYAQYKGGTVRLEPSVYDIHRPIYIRPNTSLYGAFRGAHLFDTSCNIGTVLKWAGDPGYVMVYDGPIQGERVDNGGCFDLTLDGSGNVQQGLRSINAYNAAYARLHCFGVTRWAYYFGTMNVPSVVPNYHSRLDDLTAVVVGTAHGIVLDGVTGPGRNTCFLSARNCHITFQDGVAFALSNCDDCGFMDCAGSMITGASGTAIYFGGSSDGSEKSAYGNRFIGFNSNSYIVASGGAFPSRGNLVVTNAVDGVPKIYQEANATLTVEVYDGEVSLNGFVRNPLKTG